MFAHLKPVRELHPLQSSARKSKRGELLENNKEKNKLKELQRRKKHKINLCLNDEDKELFSKILVKEKKTAQRFLYDRVFNDKIENTKDYKLLAFQIRKAGILLNQFLRLINQGRTIQDDEIIKVLNEVNQNLNTFLEKEKGGRNGGNT